jgi:hypothetical protein
MNKDKALLYSLPIQWLFIAIIVPVIIGCSNTPYQRQESVTKSFTNQTVQVKATTYIDQFIVRCEDGSIWEVKTDTTSYINPLIVYKNCLFDALYKTPEKPVAPLLPTIPPLPLER